MNTQIMTQMKELEKLFCWYEFYTQNNNEIEANNCQKQIEEKKRTLKFLKTQRRGKDK